MTELSEEHLKQPFIGLWVTQKMGGRHQANNDLHSSLTLYSTVHTSMSKFPTKAQMKEKQMENLMGMQTSWWW